jgi:hypothetical protein
MHWLCIRMLGSNSMYCPLQMLVTFLFDTHFTRLWMASRKLLYSFRLYRSASDILQTCVLNIASACGLVYVTFVICITFGSIPVGMSSFSSHLSYNIQYVYIYYRHKHLSYSINYVIISSFESNAQTLFL